MALNNEQKAELKDILGPVIIEQVDERMKKLEESIAKQSEKGMEEIKTLLRGQIDRKFNPGAGKEGGAPPESSGKFKSFGDFLHTVKRNPMDVRLKTGMTEGDDTHGGFLVPEEYRATLLSRTIEESIVRPFATVLPMSSDTMNIPKVVDTSHASTLFGGVVAYWTEEAGSKTATEPDFGQVKLIAKKLTGYTYCSDELLQDSAITLDALLTSMFGRAIAWYEDLAFLRGSGVGQPFGIQSSGAFLTPFRHTLLLVALTDLAAIMARMYPQSLYGPSTIWIISPAVLDQLVQMVSTVITWLPVGTDVGGGGAATRIPGTILGMPFRVTEKVPTLGTAGDIGLYDLSYYLIGDRGDLRIDSSMHVRFTTDETAWRFVKRVDGESWVDAAFTPYNAGDTLSPFVSITTATS